MRKLAFVVGGTLLLSAAVLWYAMHGFEEMRSGDIHLQPRHKSVWIGVLPPGMTSPFHTQIAWGAVSAGKTYGYHVVVRSPVNEIDVKKQVALMGQMIKEHLSAICINPMSDTAIKADISAANRSGIPIFMYNGLTPSVAGHITEYIGYNQRRAGYLLGQYANKLLHGHGDVLVLDGIPSYYTTERVNGFKQALLHHPGIHIVAEAAADWLRDVAVRVTTQALQDHPQIRLVFGASDEMAIGASIAARDEGKKVYTLGIDGNPVTLYEIRQGDVTATIGTFPANMGATLVHQIHAFLAGEKIPQYLVTPAVLVTSANVLAYESGKLWRAPQSGLPEAEATSTKSAQTGGFMREGGGSP